MPAFSSLAISVLGCGWLGFPLAQHLVDLGARVKGSTTTSSKQTSLKASGIEPFLISASPHSINKNKEFFAADILFLNIPFKRSLPDPAIYEEQIKQVTAAVQKSLIKFLIFASSTAIYPDTMPFASEDIIFTPDNPRAATLFRIEENLRQSPHFATTILRFAGLYGRQRKIGKFLSGKADVTDGQRPVNLVHLDDCVEIITEVIRRDIKGEILNVCSNCHPTRQELYTQAALAEGLPAPEFLKAQKSSSGKIVSNKKLKNVLDYKFKHADPLKDLEKKRKG